MIEENDEIQNQEKMHFWQPHIRAWEESGVSQAEYCRRQGLNIKIFGYWKRKLCSKTHDLSFVPVTIKPSQVSKSDTLLRLIIRGDSCIEISDGFNQDTLRRVLDTLGCRP